MKNIDVLDAIIFIIIHKYPGAAPVSFIGDEVIRVCPKGCYHRVDVETCLKENKGNLWNVGAKPWSYDVEYGLDDERLAGLANALDVGMIIALDAHAITWAKVRLLTANINDCVSLSPQRKPTTTTSLVEYYTGLISTLVSWDAKQAVDIRINDVRNRLPG